ncbi:MAG TPA: lysylphosphatidylglycerol synthase domain-containing protein [Noviherbaspirillum sp.]|nr:lysylphosphatidylglycerol synthase domain-containing protein [Noviherbaspirillum sp.]
MIDRHRAWTLFKRVLTVAFISIVLVLLVTQLRDVDWGEVRASLGRYQAPVLLLAFALAAASHALYGLFDQIGRVYTGHRLARLRVARIAFVSYAFNLNMGAMIGGVGFRYRLYSRYGLDGATITRVMGLSVAANWLGYLVVGGTVFAMREIALPAGWEIGTAGLQWIGFAMLAAAAGYLAACGLSRRRSWTVRGHEIVLPSLRMALLQVLISSLNWMLIAALIHVLLFGQVSYLTVLAVFLISAIAGVLAHIPAGLGVIELVFVTLLGHLLAPSELIAALFAYRAVYYLAPLALALFVYLHLETRAKAHAQ